MGDIWLLASGVQTPHRAYRLTAATHLIGRSPRAQIIIEHPSVSRRHAEVTLSGASIVVRDLGSANGTFIDGGRIVEARLPIGAFLQVGHVALKLIAELDPTMARIEQECMSTAEEEGDFVPTPLGDDGLSPAQRRVLELLLHGSAEKKIARALKLSRHTIHVHVRSIYRIMGVHSRSELMALYVTHVQAPAAPLHPDRS